MNAVDTNILIYAAEKTDHSKREIARDLIQSLEEGVTLWQVACEFIAVSRKLSHQGFTYEKAWLRLAEYTTVLPLALPSSEVLEQARMLHLDHQWSFWDALIVAACQEAGVKRLYSEDLPGHQPPGDLEIINPFA